MPSHSPLTAPRLMALGALLSFVPVVYTFFTEPAFWADYPGIAFHLFIFILVARLPAPDWVKMAGYGWLVIDVTVGAMTMNGVGEEIFAPMRLGGHIFAGIWIVGASLQGATAMRWLGILTGAWLGGFTFVAPFAPVELMYPPALLLILWLGVIAWKDGNGKVLAEA